MTTDTSYLNSSPATAEQVAKEVRASRDGEKWQKDLRHPRWAVKRIDRECLMTAAQATAWAAQSLEDASPDAEN